MSDPLTLVEIASPLIIASFLWLMLRRAGRSGARALGANIAIIAASSWIAEVSCIRLYRFYQYDADWTVLAGDMPLLVALIWPVVILSARQLAHALTRSEVPAAPVVFLLVLYDASLVEPVAVKAGLWSWNQPGLFGVPIIGVLGWAYFAFFTLIGLDRLRGWRKLALLVLAPGATHLALLVSWWGFFRWLPRQPIPDLMGVTASLIASVSLATLVLRTRVAAGLEIMLPRMAAAGLFFALLFMRGRDLLSLVVYALAFSVPYFAATRWKLESSEASTQRLGST